MGTLNEEPKLPEQNREKINTKPSAEESEKKEASSDEEGENLESQEEVNPGKLDDNNEVDLDKGGVKPNPDRSDDATGIH